MFRKIFISSFVFLISVFGSLNLTLAVVTEPGNLESKPQIASSVDLKMYYGAECPHCHRQIAWLPTLQIMYPNLTIEKFEVWHNETNQNQMQRDLKALGKESGSVPTNILFGKEVVIGFVKEKILEAVEARYGGPVMDEASAQRLADKQKPEREKREKADIEAKKAGKKKIFGIIAGVILAIALGAMAWTNQKK